MRGAAVVGLTGGRAGKNAINLSQKTEHFFFLVIFKWIIN